MASEITEHEALSRFINGMKEAEGAARILGHYRRDVKWIQVATNIGMILEKCILLAERSMRKAS